MVAIDPLQNLLKRLDGVRKSGRGYVAKCPAHADKRPSLSVATGDGGRVLVRCFAGCPTPDIAAAVGLTMADLFADVAPATHRVGRGMPPTPRPRPQSPEPDPRMTTLAGRAHDARPAMVARLAGELGVSADSLDALRAGYLDADELARHGTRCRGEGAWTFPMRDARGVVVGVRLRGGDGFKWSVKGGRQGLFAPVGVAFDPSRPMVVAEGASDAAALLTLGLQAVGLPSAGSGGDVLLDLLRRANPARVLLLADADDAGERGADAVARTLAEGGVGCRVASLPHGKDARAYLNAGGDARGILDLLDEMGAADAK